MKKIITVTIALFATALCFAQNVRGADWYIQAENLSQKAIELQEEGFYEESITTSKDALIALDTAILDAQQVLMQTKTGIAKNGAEKAIDMAKKIGSAEDSQFKEQFDSAVEKYNAATALLPAAAEVKTDETAINEAFAPIIVEFETVTQTVSQINNSYFTRQTQKATTLIAAAKSRYTDLSNKKVITTGSADDVKVTGAINAADASLQQNNYSGVEANVKTAQDLMSALDNAFAAQQAAAKKQIDEANTRFNQLKSANIIAAGSAEEKNISGLLTNAQTAYSEGTFPAAQQNVTNANNAMTAADNAFKTAQAAAQKAIADASAKQKQLNENGILPASGTDNANIAKLISDASAALTASDNNKALQDANNALSSMNAIEQNYTALTNSIQQLIAQAKTGQSQLEQQYPNTKDSPEYMAIGDDISAAETELAAKSLVPAQQSAQTALDRIAQLRTELETLAAKEKAEADALAAKMQAEKEERDALYTADGKYKILPKFYTVVGRKPVSATDCMWRIAQYSFIYGDKYQWKPIYDLNKNSFPRPINPNLIYPGQVLEIPSINGEKRDGIYDDSVNYIDFAEAVKNAAQ